ncbi:MAG: winged helix-turn-helix transcriptional regulator [Halomonas sp.]|nr:metalloregulator ArsR/SmtB family transcription factor [Halomonas sp.]TVM07881.1 MAG: winged helix-turn-helix transcriptional regulator [Halomonas sp.]
MPPSASAASDLLQDKGLAIDMAASLLKAMANEKRLQIICLLADQELSVTQINHYLALSQSALSQHLAILRRENLVQTRRESQTIYYSLNSESAKAIISTLASYFSR